jgi:bifunctional non-homologous end joining protein LigD
LAVFERIRYRRADESVFSYAFDLLELDGADPRREPLETRKATLASLLRGSRPGVRLCEHLEHEDGAVVFRHACAMGLEGIVSKRRKGDYRTPLKFSGQSGRAAGIARWT